MPRERQKTTKVAEAENEDGDEDLEDLERVCLRMRPSDLAKIKQRAKADDVPWPAWFRRFVRRALARQERGRIA